MSSAQILNFATHYSLYSGTTIFILGVIGNTINILVFTRLKLFQGNRSAFYLTVESLSNLFYEFLNFALTMLILIYGDDATARSFVWCKVRFILVLMPVLTTSYMICCAAIDQFFSTNHHPHLRQLCTLKLARYITATLICIWIAHSITFGMFFDIEPTVGCILRNRIALQYASFFVYPVLTGLLPIVIASFFSLLAFRNVRRIVRRQIPIVRRRLDRQMTAMVLLRVILFVSLVLPYTFYRIYALNHPVSRTLPMEYAISQLFQSVFLSLIMINYMANFYIFMISSARFRRQVKTVLVKKCWKQWKHVVCCFKNNEIVPENAESFGANVELEEDS